MRKDQLDTKTEYAYWNGPGGFAIPRYDYKAQNAVNNTQRVVVLATDADADTTDWLVPPKATGVLFKVLDPKTGEDTFQDGKLITKWVSSARDFAMTWAQFRAIVGPIVEEIEKAEKREAELEALSEHVAEALATRLNLNKDKHVRVHISEWHARHRGAKQDDLHESISIDINFETITDLEAWLHNRKA